jgi:predicted nucleic acid-binding protein
MWIESVSTLHAMLWRGELRSEQAESMRDRVLAAPVRRREPDGLALEAWKIADELGWAKTYDANYVARSCGSPEMSARDAGCPYAPWDGAAGVRGWAD